MADEPISKPLAPLTEKQKIFCSEYILDWNGTRAAIAAGYSESSAREIASQNLTKLNILAHIKYIQANLEIEAGISRLKVINEWKKMGFSSIAHMHNTWITLKDFEELTDDQKQSIESIETKTVKRDFDETHIETEYVKIKLYSKEKALENISKMLGYNEPEKVKVQVETVKMPDIPIEFK